MQNAFRGEDELTAGTEGFAEPIAWIFVERGLICLICLFDLASVKTKAVFPRPTSPPSQVCPRGWQALDVQRYLPYR